MTESLKAPFVYFGGKRKVAAGVWAALGDVDNYVEPFAGSLAVLLGRPHDLMDGRARAETVNDADHMLANFWRALASDPDGVAAHADGPVNEDDLFARHLWLVNEGRTRIIAGLENDPDWFDAKVAGWWVWGINAWIGSGWCSGAGPWTYTDGDERPSKRPHLGNGGQGVNRKLPHLGDAGQGVNRQLPHLGDAGQVGFNRLEHRAKGITDYMRQLADRLSEVRVCTGDWSRVVTNGALSFGSTVGVFLDPPYLGGVRTKNLYAHDDHHIAHDVRQWCLDNEHNPRLRIVLAGYTAEHDALIPETWSRHHWTASASYQTTNSAASVGGNQDNRATECLWMSPHCITPEPEMRLW